MYYAEIKKYIKHMALSLQYFFGISILQGKFDRKEPFDG